MVEARRDALGRFARPDGRVRKRGGSSRIGMRGPSALADQTRLELARTLTRLRLELNRAERELRSEQWSPPVAASRPNMYGIKARQAASVAGKIRALHLVMQEMAEEREPLRPTRIAARLRERLGAFDVSQLYRAPLDTMWRDTRDHLGADAARDGVPSVRRLMRLNKGDLIYQIVRMRRLVAEANTRCSERLVALSDDPDWTPMNVVSPPG